MEIPYKGYTIIPNSERQPDGRWLPVADLEANSRGVVTPRPPLRATHRETRATRADADATAVKMAKAWIEGIERGGDEARVLTGASQPGAPIETPVTPPRLPPEPRVQDARVKAPPRARKLDPLSWPRLHEAIGLDSDDRVDRFTRLLAIHSLLDRLVTLVLARKLVAGSESKRDADAETILDATASLPIVSRVALALTLNVVSPAAAESILEIDRARHGLVHSKPTRGKSAWDVSGAVETVAQESLRKGLEAAQGLMSMLRPPAPEA
ncbi:MAG TPA: hypothetical protein VLK35_11110 [Methylomirabilota bacterium]|jgi:hypothetical protein|nr:hypothetical protein [Methylomirabilota bacterium]